MGRGRSLELHQDLLGGPSIQKKVSVSSGNYDDYLRFPVGAGGAWAKRAQAPGLPQ